MKPSPEPSLYVYYTPPESLGLPASYYLEVPSNENIKGFQFYIENLIPTLSEIYYSEISVDDFKILFSSNNTIFSLKIADSDTIQGSIEFPRLVKGYSACLKVFRDAASFIATGLQIFSNSSIESQEFISHCRGLQSEHGSYVARVELPSDSMHFMFDDIDGEEVINNIISSFDFYVNEASMVNLNTIDRNYVLGHSEVLNVEVMSSVKSLFKNSALINAEVEVLNNSALKRVIVKRFNQSRIRHSEEFIKKVKDILLQEEETEVIGKVVRLYSQSPQSSRSNKVDLEAVLGNERKKVTTVLKPEDYLIAIKAHQEEYNVTIKGMAVQRRDYLFIPNPSKFSFESTSK